MTLEVSGHAIHTATVGEGAPQAMIHCALARHEALLPLARALGGRSTLIDMPGHGRSADWDGKADYQQLVTDAAAACCDGPTHVIGHSFGGTAALRLAVERPDLINRLTLIEPVYFAAARGTSEHDGHKISFHPFIAAMLKGEEAHAAEVFNGLWGGVPWERIPERQRKYLVDRIHLIVAGGAAIEEDADGITSPARLAEVNVPVTLIRGEQAQPVIGAIHDRLADCLPKATQHVVPGADHMAPMSHAAEVAAIIRSEDPQTG